MDVLTLALALALSPGDLEDPLPRRLSDSLIQEAEPPLQVDHAVLVGGHVGVVDREIGDNHSPVIGFEWRIHILPWLAAGGSVDYQTDSKTDEVSGADYFQVPLMWSLLLSLPLDLGPFRPYGLVGGGFTITYVSGELLREVDLTILYFTGVGLEVELSSAFVLDAGFRYVKTQEPIGSRDFSADWSQLTVGLLYKLTK